MKEIKDYLPEVFVPVDGYNGLYDVSNWGRVKSYDREANCRNRTKRIVKGKILKTPLSGPGKGYPSFNFFNKEGTSKRFLIHRLVGKHFIANPNNLPEINHKFGNKLDNYFEHLEWTTRKDNINHAFDTGLNKKVEKNKGRSKPVIQLNLSMQKIGEYPSLIQVQRSTGFKYPNIHHAIKNKKISNGYYWQYKN